MTTPQLDNGFTQIANEILEALALFRIPGEQRQCLDVILRKTYGFRKLEDRIANSQFCQATGLKKGNVSRSIKSLVAKNLVIKNDNTSPPTYRFNKQYKKWKVLSKMQPVIKDATVVIKSDKKVLSKVMDTKEKKETIQKKTTAFDCFWGKYPKKVGKEAASKAWGKIEINIHGNIMSAIDAIMPEWNNKEKRFIPHASTWLNEKRWNDELDNDGAKNNLPDGIGVYT